VRSIIWKIDPVLLVIPKSAFPEIVAERPLKFFPGRAYGTLFPSSKANNFCSLVISETVKCSPYSPIVLQFMYKSERGAHPARIMDLDSADFCVYYNGGCAFAADHGYTVICYFFKQQN
jgi:glutamine amidotransferase-like uncharacterized protein